MTALEWAQKKRTRARMAAEKNPKDENLRQIWFYWKDIVKALHILKDIEAQREYEAAVDQMEHDILYEPTYSQEDGSM